MCLYVEVSGCFPMTLSIVFSNFWIFSSLILLLAVSTLIFTLLIYQKGPYKNSGFSFESLLVIAKVEKGMMFLYGQTLVFVLSRQLNPETKHLIMF